MQPPVRSTISPGGWIPFWGWLRNKSFEEWGEIFGDNVMAAAHIDRLLHHCHVVNIRGNSYRMRHHAELWTTLNAPHDEHPPKTRRGRREEATVPSG